MEIEHEESNKKQTNPLEEPSKIQYLSQMLGIKIQEKDIDMFTDLNDLCLFINGIKFNDKKKNEIKENISENIKKLNKKESLDKYNEEKTKKFSEIVKLNGKTTKYHTAEKDKLSPTMSAFYFSDKTKQVFSDKQTAEYKAMHFNTGYELSLEPALKTKEEDNLSSYSNFKGLMNVRVNDTTNEKVLKKKRKSSTNFSCKSKSCKKRKLEKVTKTEDYNNNKGNENEMDGKEEIYCFEDCKYNRHSKGMPMIQCDKCKGWYHFRCLDFTHEEYLKYEGKGKPYFCPYCVEPDIDDKKVNDGINNANKN